MAEIIWQDLVFMIGGFIFAPALLFSIKAKTLPALKTSIPTVLVLSVFTGTYLTMHYYLAVISTALTVAAWAALMIQAFKVRSKKRRLRDVRIVGLGIKDK